MYLEGTHIDPKDSVGKRVKYLTTWDIDKSGRGYFFPREAVIVDKVKRQLITEAGEYIPCNKIVEMIILDVKGKEIIK